MRKSGVTVPQTSPNPQGLDPDAQHKITLTLRDIMESPWGLRASKLREMTERLAPEVTTDALYTPTGRKALGNIESWFFGRGTQGHDALPLLNLEQWQLGKAARKALNDYINELNA
ncbi:hypothetical protein FE257_011041 [Aspergillus nanangensis]|uniref:Uncharacterized protein n=1 Tax=Aspergillus nanangensis TaxID=2582783 RepID=A0AAD4CHX0_ASPNN|nr:hypothetical protein FE257_011041 [Aspergillus nanangensis]